MFAHALTYFTGLFGWKLGLLITGLHLQGAVVSPFPEEVILITSGICWGQGQISFGEALFYNGVGLVLGNFVPMAVGLRFGDRILRWPPLRRFIDPDGVQAALERIKQRGDWIIFISRFTPFIRGPIYLAAGIAKMSVVRFFVVDTIAAVLQVSLILWAGKKMGDNSESLLIAYQRVGLLMLALLLGGAAWGFFRRPRTRLPTV